MPQQIRLKAQTLELLGLKEKDLTVYLTLLQLGSAPLRTVAVESGLNRGTVYDALKRLMDSGLVRFVDAKSHRYFVAEDPQKLRGLATRREVAIQEARETLDALVPELRALIGKDVHRPAVRYFEGEEGIKEILRDVLSQTKRTKKNMYRVYSCAGIRDRIAQAWPGYKTQRKKEKIFCRAISFGEGGETVGLDERRWLSRESSGSTYIFVYADRTAYVALDKHDRLFGVTIDDVGIAGSQEMIFDALWKGLAS